MTECEKHADGRRENREDTEKNSKQAHISVYTADTAALDDDRLFGKLYAAVSERRKRKTDRYRFRKNKNQSLCAEYLLMCACREFGVDYGSEIREGDGGKPAFAASSVSFNLSHSEKRAMCVMADCEVGCDVEKIERCNPELARRFFAAAEIQALENCETDTERDILFYRIWTLKESYLKCTGQGITVPLSSFSVVADGKIRKVLETDDADYLLFEEKKQDSYCYALCVKTERGAGRKAYERIKEEIRVDKIEIDNQDWMGKA